MKTLSDEQRLRAEDALKETRLALNKELSYSEDLQDKKMIEFYRSQILKLEKMLKSN